MERSVWGCALFRITIASRVLDSKAERVLVGPMGVCRRQRRVPEERLQGRKALGEWQTGQFGRLY